MQNIIAVICDCDDTLIEDTTSALLKKNDIDVDDFWNDINNKFVLNGWDPPLAYLSEILRLFKSGKIKENTPQKMQNFAKKLKPFPGVNDFFSRLQNLIDNDPKCIQAGISLECYIISAGIEDLVRGCPFAKHFTDIFGGQFEINKKTKKYSKLKSTVTFTEKTKFLYAINKGITGKNLRRYPYLVNKAVKKHHRRIPFENMIYIGDGPTDIPCFSAVRGYDGHCIGIFDKQKTGKAYELAKEKRTNYGIYSRNFKPESDLSLMVKTIITEIRDKIICNS